MCGNMPMMIFILAAGYLFTVYLLLALAKRTGKNSAPTNHAPKTVNRKHPLSSRVTEVANSQ